METEILSSGMPVEKRPHVEYRVDGHAGHADVADHALMVGVVAAVRRKIEGDREPRLPGREVAPVEGVGFLGGREAGVLPDVHGRITYMVA
jgi:hypothetical protein